MVLVACCQFVLYIKLVLKMCISFQENCCVRGQVWREWLAVSKFHLFTMDNTCTVEWNQYLVVYVIMHTAAASYCGELQNWLSTSTIQNTLQIYLLSFLRIVYMLGLACTTLSWGGGFYSCFAWNDLVWLMLVVVHVAVHLLDLFCVSSQRWFI
mgnify:CR=1 FL=1